MPRLRTHRLAAAAAVLLLLCVECGAASTIRGAKQSNFRQDIFDVDEDEKGNGAGTGVARPNLVKPHEVRKRSNSNEDVEPPESETDMVMSSTADPVSSTLAPLSSAATPPSPPTVITQMSAEQKAACEAATNGQVFKTETSVTVRFLYELLSPDDRAIGEVASSVDERVRGFLIDELVDCEQQTRSNVGGVGPGKDAHNAIKDSCSNLVAGESQSCHLMAGSVVLYLLSSDESNSEEEAFDPVSDRLKIAFNGEQRVLQSRFVDRELGILGLCYVGDYVYEDNSISSSPVEDTAKTSNIFSEANESEASSSPGFVPVIIATAVLVSCFVILSAIVFVHKRRKWNEQAKGIMVGDDGSDDIGADSDEDKERWKQKEEGKYSLRFSVVDTEAESDSSCCSVDSAVAAHERVMRDFTSLTVSDSLSGESTAYSRPVFVDPNAVTLYSRSRTRYSFERSYSMSDTVEI